MTIARSITARTIVTNESSKQEDADRIDRSGALVSGEVLWRGLGYRTAASFRQAAHRKTVPIHVFDLPNRRGKHAFRAELDAWVKALMEREGTPVLQNDNKEGPT